MRKSEGALAITLALILGILPFVDAVTMRPPWERATILVIVVVVLSAVLSLNAIRAWLQTYRRNNR
jgi:uncharacterized protein (DUF983 family)